MANPDPTQPNPEKDPRDWVTGDEPATGPQLSYLGTLAQQAGEEVPSDLSKADASRLIDELQQKTGRSGGGTQGGGGTGGGGTGGGGVAGGGGTQGGGGGMGGGGGTQGGGGRGAGGTGGGGGTGAGGGGTGGAGGTAG